MREPGPRPRGPTRSARRGCAAACSTPGPRRPARFREDANAEEDLALGGYRDRLVVELAQNAADAAARAGVPGRLRLTLHADADAPRARRRQHRRRRWTPPASSRCRTLRASAKRDEARAAVGRFGVGFAAVLAVSDEPAVVGRHGGVRWSLAEARELAAEAAAAAPASATSCAAATATCRCCGCRCPPRAPPRRLRHRRRPAAARRAPPRTSSSRLLDGVDDALLLALPGLTEVVVETRRRHADVDAAAVDGPYVADRRTRAATAATRWRRQPRSGAAGPPSCSRTGPSRSGCARTGP